MGRNNIRDSNVQFSWFINDNRIPAETSDILQINEFSESYDNSVVKCAAGNDEIIRAVQLKLNRDEKPESTIVTFDQVMQQTQKDVMLSDEESNDDEEDDENWEIFQTEDDILVCCRRQRRCFQ